MESITIERLQRVLSVQIPRLLQDFENAKTEFDKGLAQGQFLIIKVFLEQYCGVTVTPNGEILKYTYEVKI